MAEIVPTTIFPEGLALKLDPDMELEEEIDILHLEQGLRGTGADVIEDDDGDGDDERGGGISITMKKLISRVKLLEQQMAACLQNQPLVYQLFSMCSGLEQRLKAMKRDVDGRLNEIKTGYTATPRPLRTSDNDHDTEWTADIDRDVADGDENDGDSGSDGGDENYKPRPRSSRESAEIYCRERTDQRSKSMSLPYQCKICNDSSPVRFPDRRSLANHYTSQHSPPSTDEPMTSTTTGNKVSSSRSSTSSTTLNVNVTRGKLPNLDDLPACLKCRKTFKSEARMQDHLNADCTRPKIRRRRIISHRRHRTGIGQPDLDSSRPERGPGRPRSGRELKYPCPDGCGRSFHSQCILKRHIISCRGLRPHKCDECDFSCGFPWNLKEHKKYTHSKPGEERHFCEHCGQGFFNNKLLQVHIRRHTGERPYTCPHCEKKFISQSTLRNHIPIHTGTGHVCETCGKNFTRAANFNHHKRICGEATKTPKVTFPRTRVRKRNKPKPSLRLTNTTTDVSRVDALIP